MTNKARFTVVDDLILGSGDHNRLLDTDECGFLFEWTKGQDFKTNRVSSLIANIKKKPNEASAAELRYKEQDIALISTWLRDATNSEWTANGTFVPVPPSKAVGDPNYDDRMERICRGIAPDIDVRNLVTQSVSVQATHDRLDGQRYTPDELIEMWAINEMVATPKPMMIAIVDDMLTAGSHYRAMYTLLVQRFPEVPIVGMFIARRIFAVAGQTD